MFEEIQKNFYESLVKSMKDRKKFLKLIRDDILSDPARVSKILNITRDAHHPYLIGKNEYPRLIYLFLCKDHDSFKKEDILNVEIKKLREKCGNNYDKMLWEHIDWDKMFQDVITELSKFDISEEPGKTFEKTLVDYIPYAVIKYDELPFNYPRIFIFPVEKEQKRRDAIEWVHLRHGSGLFKQTFYKRFSGKTLLEFDKEFPEFISDYLHERKPNPYSLGSQAYNTLKNISGYVAYWASLDEVQYSDISDKKSDLVKLLEEYIKNGREQIQKFEKYQKDFDVFHIDIK